MNRYAKGKGLLKDKDDNLLGEDIREGLTAIISVKLPNPQFEGQTKNKLGNTEMRSLVEKVTNEKLADWLEENPTEARQAVGKATQAAHARMAARQARDLTRRKSLLESSAMPGKLADCASKQPGRVGAVHRRGRQRRRQRQARPRPAHAGDPADPRQDPQRRARPPRQDAEERGDPGAHHRDRLRRRRRVRPREAPLPQDRDHGRRRRRRLPHPHAAAHVLLPAAHRDREARAHLHRAAAAVPRRHRQGAHVPQGRSGVARVRGGAREQQDQDQPLQGSRGDGLAGARRDHHEPGHAHAPPGVGGRSRHRRRGVLQAHGRRRRVPEASSSNRTRRTCASSTRERAARRARRNVRSTPVPKRQREVNPCPTTTASSRRSTTAMSNRSSSRRRWNAPSSSTRCRSSPRAPCPTCATG